MTTTGRNTPCPCGSGKKYKKCCLAKAAIQPVPPSAPAPRQALARSADAPARVEARGREDALDEEWELGPAESDDDRFW